MTLFFLKVEKVTSNHKIKLSQFEWDRKGSLVWKTPENIELISDWWDLMIL